MSALAAAPPAGPSLVRLTGIELRKMVDTRSGRWLLATVALLIAATIVISVLVGEADLHRLDGMFEFALAPIGILLPILGILSVTSEWSQRTTLLTFALVPRRERVTAAKALAACLLGALGLVVCLAAAAVGNLIVDRQLGEPLLTLVEAAFFRLIGGDLVARPAPAEAAGRLEQPSGAVSC